jgi:hypothetical protein
VIPVSSLRSFAPWRLCVGGFIHHAFAFNLGIGKQNKKNGIHRKMMSSNVTMIISNSSAQIVMIGIESEQIIPISIPESLLHGPPSGTERSL